VPEPDAVALTRCSILRVVVRHRVSRQEGNTWGTGNARPGQCRRQRSGIADRESHGRFAPRPSLRSFVEREPLHHSSNGTAASDALGASRIDGDIRDEFGPLSDPMMPARADRGSASATRGKNGASFAGRIAPSVRSVHASGRADDRDRRMVGFTRPVAVESRGREMPRCATNVGSTGRTFPYTMITVR